MTVTLTKPTVKWGVQSADSRSPDSVTVSADEASARKFLRGLRFCGNTDVRLVTDDGTGWRPADTTGGAQ